MIIRDTDKAAKKLTDIRREIAGLQAQIKETERAPLAESDLRGRVRTMIGVRLTHDETDSMIRSLPFPRVDGRLPDLVESPSWGTLCALLGRDVIEDKLCAMATAAMKTGGMDHGLPRAEREAKIIELRTEIRKLERAEIVEMARLEDSGHDVLPRKGQDAALMLEVWGELGGGSAVTGGADPVRAEPHINDGAALHRAPV